MALAAATLGVMNIGKHIIGAALLAMAVPALAGGEGWTSDFKAAKEEAAKSGKDLLVDFTGSDWCGWCIKLDKEVFQHDEFKTGVKDSFVLVEIDFPKDKSKISAETLEQNKELGKKYGVRGYPTILLLDEKGRPYAKTGYRKGGPEAYVAHLNEFKATRVARDEAFEKAEAGEGLEKAKAFVAALDTLTIDEGMVAEFYGDTIEKIKAADPNDETGYAKRGESKKRFMDFQKSLQGFAKNKDWDSALGLVDETVEKGELAEKELFGVEMMRVMIHAEQGSFEEAIKSLDAIKEKYPENPMGPRLGQLRSQLEAAGEKAKDE